MRMAFATANACRITGLTVHARGNSIRGMATIRREIDHIDGMAFFRRNLDYPLEPDFGRFEQAGGWDVLEDS